VNGVAYMYKLKNLLLFILHLNLIFFFSWFRFHYC